LTRECFYWERYRFSIL